MKADTLPDLGQWTQDHAILLRIAAYLEQAKTNLKQAKTYLEQAKTNLEQAKIIPIDMEQPNYVSFSVEICSLQSTICPLPAQRTTWSPH